jgi:hypothetical protein
MSDSYLLDHLLKLAKLFYSDKEKYCTAFKRGKYFMFGYEKGDEVFLSSVTKPVAIYLSVGVIVENPTEIFSIKKPKIKRRRKHGK